ncbi:MAG: translation initiation factor IF-2 [SAR324 cluster bacterium]|nr:translation initiation factor IF-2 [SAR324 cluster bacterium]MBL7035338.1 translation initiation factor IF-2 [SAR324 cluster bacterium]
MSEVRVFELAKELSMPAKQLLTKIRKAGIPVTGNFSELSLEQANIVRKMAKSAKGIVLPKSSEGTGLRRVRRTAKVTGVEELDQKKKPTKKTKSSKIVTISTKSQLEEEQEPEAPKRRIRRKKKDTDDTVSDIKTERTEDSKTKTSADATLETPPSEVVGEEPEKEDRVIAADLSEPNDSPLENAESITENKVNASPDDTGSLQQAEDLQKEKSAGIDKLKEDIALKSTNKPKKTTVAPTPEQSEDAENDSSKRKGSRRTDGEQKRKGGGGQRDYLNFRERRPRHRKRDYQKDKRNRGPRKISDPNVPKHVFNPRKKSIRIGNQVIVAELAGLIGIKAPEIIKKLISLGLMATINQTISGEMAELVAADFNVTVEVESFELADLLKEEEPDVSELELRSPIVTIMGHVDHGKTSLLDKIRETRIASGEAGGITQHIGAYHLKAGGNQVTFLDTPGHKAFTSMRARGANITDIVILVVAADDKVQPQTIEAIQHARAADVPIIVAVNKIDRPESDPNRIQQELLLHELIPEDLGGSTIFVKVSAKTGEGLEELLEMIHLQAEVLELKSTAKGCARGTIIESRVRKGQGPVGTVLVQRGTLRIGDYFVMGGIHGRIRAMFNEAGKSMTEAGPAIPVEISGLSNVPEVGETFVVLEDEKKARQIAEEREFQQRAETIREFQKTSLDNLFSKIEEGKATELRLIIKGDVQGSVEALKSSLEQIGDERISTRFLLCSVGNITETDITLASASDAIIVGFNVQMDSKAREIRAVEGVDVRLYDVIYNALDDVKAAMEGLLEPEIREEILGHLEVRQVFSSGKNGMVVGGLVTDGKLLRNSLIRVLRKEESVFEGKIISLKRFKDDVAEVAHNYECGIILDFAEIENGDIVEAYEQIEESARL